MSRSNVADDSCAAKPDGLCESQRTSRPSGPQADGRGEQHSRECGVNSVPNTHCPESPESIADRRTVLPRLALRSCGPEIILTPPPPPPPPRAGLTRTAGVRSPPRPPKTPSPPATSGGAGSVRWTAAGAGAPTGTPSPAGPCSLSPGYSPSSSTVRASDRGDSMGTFGLGGNCCQCESRKVDMRQTLIEHSTSYSRFVSSNINLTREG